MSKKHTVTLPDSAHQPSKAELEKEVRVNVPGKDEQEQMVNFARALMRPAKIKYRKQ